MTETEFIAWISSLLETDETDPEQDLLAAFQVFDADGNGYITKVSGMMFDDDESEMYLITNIFKCTFTDCQRMNCGEQWR